MQKRLLFKMLAIGFLMLVIGVPLLMIQSTIHERMGFRQQAVDSIAADSVGRQAVVGPVLVIPYTDDYEEQVTVTNDPQKKVETVKQKAERRHLVFPNELQIAGSFDTDNRY